ncbi:hypothetical protein PQQ73_35795 [Paraburkholderia strydomiana]|jgi:hypothetical protein|uniref:Uncharacterized protein n=1 Tax=Paraburkholderia strydomiana TaxID=1245417 RepID=A0ABW9ERD3_9BURK
MKLTTAIFLLFAFSWAIQRVHAQPQLDSPEDYAYLRRIHVPDVVVNCVAAFDRWVRTAPRYDLFVISERRALSAKVIAAPAGSRAGSLTSFDTVVRTPAFAKVRGKYVWVPVNATCQVWHGHVVGLSAQQVAVQ